MSVCLNANRKIVSAFEHLTVSAKWHAGTACIATDKLHKFKKIWKQLVSPENSEFSVVFFTNSLKSLIDTASTWPGFKKIEIKLQKLLPNGLCEKILAHL